MSAQTKGTIRQIIFFYALSAVVGALLSLIDFQGIRESLEFGTGSYFENMKKEWTFSKADGTNEGLGTGGYIDNLKFGAVFLALFFIFFEYGILKLQRRADSYDWKDSGASFAIYLFNGLLSPLTLIYQFGLLKWAEPYALFQINDGLIPFLLTFLLAEGAYYWYHRLSHEVPVLWAIHHTHHSAQTLNLSVAYRLHTLGRIVSPVTYLPMVILGFKPEYVLGALAISLVYQFFIHTQTVGKVGVIEHSGFNTPSLHRVHHGRNDWCIDKNYAGVLILWDYIFGTFQREIGPIDYGVTTGHYSYNPIKLMLGPLNEWARGRFARERENVDRASQEKS